MIIFLSYDIILLKSKRTWIHRFCSSDLLRKKKLPQIQEHYVMTRQSKLLYIFTIDGTFAIKLIMSRYSSIYKNLSIGPVWEFSGHEFHRKRLLEPIPFRTFFLSNFMNSLDFFKSIRTHIISVVNETQKFKIFRQTH